VSSPLLTPARSAAALALFILLVSSAAPRAAARTLPTSFADLVTKLLPAVVNISAVEAGKPGPAGAHPPSPSSQQAPGSQFDRFYRNFFEHGQGPSGQGESPPRRETALGSGFIIDPTGYIVTNEHVIADADSITAILQDGTNLKAKLVGSDKNTDIALLKVDAGRPLPALSWGNSDKARVGDWVLAIGNPYGLGGTVTAGILSARQRDISSGPYDDFLQTDAAINRGNSGGPMFDMEGKVIGINTAIYSPSGGSIGLGFAIPSALARTVVSELMHEPDHAVHHGWLGLRVQEVTPSVAKSLGLERAQGALVASVAENGPAARAGIKPGDVILAFNGKPVTELRRLPRLVLQVAIDTTVRVLIWRHGKEEELEVAVGPLAEGEAKSAKSEPEEAAPKPARTNALGLTFSAITPEVEHKFTLDKGAKGVVVVAVSSGSEAARDPGSEKAAVRSA
jgi:serine protease Do